MSMSNNIYDTKNPMPTLNHFIIERKISNIKRFYVANQIDPEHLKVKYSNIDPYPSVTNEFNKKEIPLPKVKLVLDHIKHDTPQYIEESRASLKAIQSLFDTESGRAIIGDRPPKRIVFM
ncbi:hypothetical protein DFA_11148 [Cavenderia fasciculata]|uniref:Uncharacterized protein n=1 Tax=Cavenderia fasciculata TaxID=261658 RepID=F4QF28_CACFS|nr:uncharacterized protein DFA_11148 [Cavenderia fasciculata]EGG13387.1 hypothetical protein DFA_11148 [Cavenderia fasciculata]|eukprot:XP_004350091.1 hypothetical protein DFA_11148 [Cavenderia fasciculata]